MKIKLAATFLVGFAFAFLVFALCRGQSGQPASAVSFENEEFAKVASFVSEKTGRKLVFDEKTTGALRVSFRTDATSGEGLFMSFEAAMEKSGLALVPAEDSTDTYRVIRFETAKQPKRTGAFEPRLTVSVADGSVSVCTPSATASLARGEETSISASGAIAAARRTDVASMGLWRNSVTAPVMTARERTRLQTPVIELRVVGKSGDGQGILEYSIGGGTEELALGDGVVSAEICPIEGRKAMFDFSGGEITIPVRLKLARNGK